MAYERLMWMEDPLKRVFCGVSVGNRTRRLKTALLHCRGDAWNLHPLAVDALTQPPPDPATGNVGAAISEAILELTRRCEIAACDIEAVGLEGLPHGQLPEDIASSVAERTGITVISGFASRDRASGGRGGPLEPLADWFLFRSARLTRLLIHLGAELRVTYLAANRPASDMVAFDVCSCCDFLDGFARALSQGRYDFDPSGHFGVQGRCCDGLVTKWASHPFLLRSPPKFISHDEFGAAFREDSLAFSSESALSARDVLCSACHFLVQSLAEAIHRWLPPRESLDEVLVSGGGLWNGLLWKLLVESFADKPIARIDKANIPSEARSAAHAALLAFFVTDNLPGHLPNLSGASGPRLLGHITPGSPDNWGRWITNLADTLDVVQTRAA